MMRAPRPLLTHGVPPVFVAIMGLIVFPAPAVVWGQTDGAAPVGAEERTFAPAIPVVNTPIAEILLREVPIAERAGLALRVIRLGEAGTLSEPGVLDLPKEGGVALRPLRFDWIRAIDRNVEVRQRGSFSRLAVVGEGSQMIVVHRSRVELLTGVIEMTRRDSDAIPLSVGAGEVEVHGRGHGEVERTPTGVVVAVTSGRFEVYNHGALVGILAAGNTRRFPVPRGSFDDDLSNLRDALSGLVVTLRSSPTIDGDTLTRLWSATRRVAAGFAYREESYDPAVRDPDVMRRDIGEALRILKAFRFDPTGALGM